MTAYFIMIGVPALLAIWFSVSKRYRFSDKDKVIIDAFFCIWLLLLMFRSNRLGIDLPVYNYHFNNYSQLSWKRIVMGIVRKEFEASFCVISKLVSVFADDFHWALVVCASISVIPIWMLYRKEAKHGYLMVVLFVNIAPFVMYFSGLRQAIAMAFVVPCYYFCKKKKIIHFMVTVLCAYFAHNSALVLVAMYPVYHLKIKKDYHLLYIIPIIVIIRQFKVPIFNFLLQFMGDKYYERYGTGVTDTGAYAVLLLLVVLLIYSYIVVDTKKLDEETMGLRNLLLLCVFIQVFAGVHTLAMRMNYYYLLCVPLLIPRIIDRGQKKYYTLLKISLVCLVIFFTYYYFYEAYTGSDVLGVYPYVSVFSDF